MFSDSFASLGMTVKTIYEFTSHSNYTRLPITLNFMKPPSIKKIISSLKGKSVKFRNKIFLIICFFLLCSLIFRLSPFLFSISLQDIEKSHFHSIKFYDRNGFLLQELLSADATRSVAVEREQVSPYFLNAIIATEDKNFYNHNGIDYTAILRALY